MYVPFTAGVARRAMSARGMGVGAPCPSLQQLQGIVDPTDPCQSASAPPTVIDAATNQPVSAAEQQAYNAAWYSGLLQSFAPSTPPGGAPSTTNYLPWILGAVVVVVLLKNR